jgi:aldehyde:ferredoxin oxidoreductase
MFNVREGLDRRQDTLPARNLSQPLAGGPAGGQVVELDLMLDDYYQRMGWDPNGIPTNHRLSELGLDALIPIVQDKEPAG